jgi:hypothetical protein
VLDDLTAEKNSEEECFAYLLESYSGGMNQNVQIGDTRSEEKLSP